MKKITVIGGGTGTTVILSGLKKYDYDLSVIVTMMDSGGSTGRLRSQLEILPPGDLRQCLVALSSADETLKHLFLYRFETGDLKGHNFGNIFIAALEKIKGDYPTTLAYLHTFLKVKGTVIPVTYSQTDMCVTYEKGNTVRTEGEIDDNHTEKTKVKSAFLDPEVAANADALKRIEESNFIILGPGDIYTSIVPVLLVGGIKDAIKNSKAKLVYIPNLMTKSGQTPGYSVADHVKDITTYTGRTPDAVIVNDAPVPSDIMNWYESYGEEVVKDDLGSIEHDMLVIRTDILNTQKVEKKDSDNVSPLVRSVLRHDSHKLAKIVDSLCTTL